MIAPTASELPAVICLLEESGLPTDDLHELDLSLFRIRQSGASVHAVAGLERCGGTALVRSVATSARMRGRGYAGALVEELEALAAKEGIACLYLLTESAQRFFASRGYVPVERSDVPDSVRASRQFSSLCPDSAIVMRKRVDIP